MKSFYAFYYWCKRCGKWIEKSQAVQDVKGSPCCPNCGKRLRTRPTCTFRNRNHKTSTLGNDATPFHSPAAAEPKNTHVAKANIKHAKPPMTENTYNRNMESQQKARSMKK